MTTTKTYKAGKWSDEDVEILKKGYNKIPLATLALTLKRSASALSKKGVELGIARVNQRWTQHEDDFIVENYGKIPTNQICYKMGRDLQGVYDRANKLGVKIYGGLRNEN